MVEAATYQDTQHRELIKAFARLAGLSLEALEIPKAKTKHEKIIRSLLQIAKYGGATDVDFRPFEADICYAALERYHPEGKILTADIKRFQVRLHGEFNAPALYFETSNGWQYLSVDAIFGRKSSDAETKLRQACRAAIDPQVRAFKRTYGLKGQSTALCEVSQQEFPLQQLVVDHYPMSFNEIFKAFFEDRLQKQGKTYDDCLVWLEKVGNGERWTFKPAHKSKKAHTVCAKFYEYHAQNAHYRLVEASINSSLGDHGYSSDKNAA